ncbi:hypothetical protein [Actinoalloteichus hymeniacidonis]|uniref:hypothetical protein n=1 Tax=Actinoalloteichus hymeniacidonis TaxID=340345 RepID=UPI001619228B|nr:hypothetical protein [Actinoalloteichus hymeniacidonis]
MTLTACTGEQAVNARDQLPSSCLNDIEIAISNTTGDLYNQERHNSEHSEDSEPQDDRPATMQCSANFLATNTKIEGPSRRFIQARYLMLPESDLFREPILHATTMYSDQVEEAEISSTVRKLHYVADEAHYWHDEEGPFPGARVIIRDRNLLINISFSGEDRSADQEVPMSPIEAQESAQTIAKAIAETL